MCIRDRKTILNKQTDFTGEFPEEWAKGGLWRFNESDQDEDDCLDVYKRQCWHRISMSPGTVPRAESSLITQTQHSRSVTRSTFCFGSTGNGKMCIRDRHSTGESPNAENASTLSQILQAEDNEIEEYRQKLAELKLEDETREHLEKEINKFTYASIISISGEGIKMLVRVRTEDVRQDYARLYAAVGNAVSALSRIHI